MNRCIKMLFAISIIFPSFSYALSPNKHSEARKDDGKIPDKLVKSINFTCNNKSHKITTTANKTTNFTFNSISFDGKVLPKPQLEEINKALKDYKDVSYSISNCSDDNYSIIMIPQNYEDRFLMAVSVNIYQDMSIALRKEWLGVK